MTCPDPEEEYVALQRSIQTLQTQITMERSYREAAEREIELTARENKSLEQQLAHLDGCGVRKQELEAEVEQLRLLWRRDCAYKYDCVNFVTHKLQNQIKSLDLYTVTLFRRPEQLLLPDTVFFASDESPSLEQSETNDKLEEENRRYNRPRCNSDSVLKATDDIRRGHEQMCIRRAEAVKQRGISLLHEVDAQYSALKVGVYVVH